MNSTKKPRNRRRKPRIAGGTGRGFACAFILVCLLGLWLRFPALDQKPLHHDEANQAVKFGQLLETGDYKYDPVDHHGPTLYYLTLPLAWLKGEKSLVDIDEWTIRLVPLVFGVALLWLPISARGALGHIGVLVAALLLATSPIFTYYSRYYVQEMLFVFFTLGALVSLWRYQTSKQVSWAFWFGLSCGLMHATKETCVLSFVAMVAGGGVLLLEPWRKVGRLDLHLLGQPAAAAWALRGWIIVALVFFSSFFTHWEGVANAFGAYFHTVDRAGGQGHEKLFSYYWNILFNYSEEGYSSSELPLLLTGLVGIIFAFVEKANNPRRRAARFLAVYALTLWLIYGLIPYKTPWLALNFLLGFALLGGHGIDRLLQVVRFNDARLAISLLLAWGLFAAHGQARLATSAYYAADMRNPYAYVHTTDDFLKLVGEVQSLRVHHKLGVGARIKIFTTSEAEHWPFPWYLRECDRVKYYVGIPEDGYLDAEFIVVHPDLKEELLKRLSKEYYDPYTDYSLREGIILNLIYGQGIRDEFIEAETAP
jgi:uncharacterized protein (TIGR03663 family)